VKYTRMRSSVLQCVVAAECCSSVLQQWVAVRCSVLQCVMQVRQINIYAYEQQYVAVCCSSVLQQCVAEWYAGKTEKRVRV